MGWTAAEPTFEGNEPHPAIVRSAKTAKQERNAVNFIRSPWAELGQQLPDDVRGPVEDVQAHAWGVRRGNRDGKP